MSKIPLVSSTDFAREVLSSSVPVLVDFSADWCAPCRVIEPILEKIAEARAGSVKVVRIDADASSDVAARFGVRALPTVIAFLGGAVHKRHTGATSMAVLTGLLPLAAV